MCVVSMIGDHYTEKWRDYTKLPYVQPLVPPLTPTQVEKPISVLDWLQKGVTRQEFDALVADVKEMKELLHKAKLYDIANNEPSCEIQSKIESLKRLADAVGIDLTDIFIGQKAA